ncbi:hypothetical protein [Oricola cellulosilytica]|uniref:Uncharacterized protein n=1 Tax=Oricola cellulosilytica TaxID=1429082 RepID=A0A4R0PFC3_9HYPH|nr:hypothetical protein [Oricola cellulosilytica]TCD15289.1 hypothetical protein E0D97_07065 [Oricola cellulosilytica]
MFTAFTHIRRERSRHHLRAVALILATLVFANIVAFTGLGVAARADMMDGALPYAPVFSKQPVFQAFEPDGAVAVDRTMVVSSIKPVTRSALRAAPPDSARNFVATRSGEPRDRFWLIVIMTAALGLLGGVSLYMLRSLANEVAASDRRRRRMRL